MKKNHLRLVHSSPDKEPLPYGLTTLQCKICNTPITETEIGNNEIIIDRIGGDSSNGTEPTHYWCVFPKPLTPTKKDRDED